MKKFLLLIPVFLILAGCNDPYLIKRQLVVVDIPEKLFQGCPVLKKYQHNWKKLTDPQVAGIIINLYQNNEKCHNAIQAIKRFQQNAKARMESN